MIPEEIRIENFFKRKRIGELPLNVSRMKMTLNNMGLLAVELEKRLNKDPNIFVFRVSLEKDLSIKIQITWKESDITDPEAVEGNISLTLKFKVFRKIIKLKELVEKHNILVGSLPRNEVRIAFGVYRAEMALREVLKSSIPDEWAFLFDF